MDIYLDYPMKEKRQIIKFESNSMAIFILLLWSLTDEQFQER